MGLQYFPVFSFGILPILFFVANQSRSDEFKHKRRESLILEGYWETSNSTISFVPSRKLHDQISSLKAYGDSFRYDLYRNKVIYFYGDSTIRQLGSLFLTKLQMDMNSTVLRDHSRTYCNSQFRPLSHYTDACSRNERECKFYFGDRNLTVYIYWKHLAFEEYDIEILSNWTSREPNLAIVSFGLHDCYHFPVVGKATTKSTLFLRNLVPFRNKVIFLQSQHTIAYTEKIAECIISIAEYQRQMSQDLDLNYFHRHLVSWHALQQKLTKDRTHLLDSAASKLFDVLSLQMNCLLSLQQER